MAEYSTNYLLLLFSIFAVCVSAKLDQNETTNALLAELTSSNVSRDDATSQDQPKSSGQLDDTIPSFCYGSSVICSDLPPDCLRCKFNYSCIYGQNVTSECEVKSNIECKGSKSFQVTHVCAFCYQLSPSSYTCSSNSTCKIDSKYLARCSVPRNSFCLGNRVFSKYSKCNFVSGTRWSTAMLLSVTLGGFGIDRFYLGDWQEGIGKLFSFGGLGVWTLVDVILIATGYLKPADGSRYI